MSSFDFYKRILELFKFNEETCDNLNSWGIDTQRKWFGEGEKTIYQMVNYMLSDKVNDYLDSIHKVLVYLSKVALENRNNKQKFTDCTHIFMCDGKQSAINNVHYVLKTFLQDYHNE